MKKAFAAAMVSLALLGGAGCGSGWSGVTPDKWDDPAIEAEIRKHMSTDGITGMSIKSNDGVVTLEGDVKNEDQHQKALADARVKGVSRIIDKIVIKP